MIYDVIVVGAGPGGSTTAHAVAEAGLTTLLLEKETLPRVKPCGGCLSAKVERIWNAAVGEAVEEVISHAHFTYRGGSRVTVAFPQPAGYMVRREIFDLLLAERAKCAGAALQAGERVIGVTVESEGVQVQTPRRVYRGRYLVGADGANGIVARALFPRRAPAALYALEAEVPWGGKARRALAGTVVVDVGRTPGGYAWAFPKAETVNVGIMWSRGALEDPRACLQEFLRCEEALTGVSVEETRAAAVPVFSGTASSVVRGRALLVGDAGGLVDPLLGEGIYYAMRSGKIAGEVLGTAVGEGPEALREYEARLKKELYTEFLPSAALAKMVYTVPRLWHTLLRRRPQSIDLYYRVLRGEESYHRLWKRVGESLRSALPRVIHPVLRRYLPVGEA